VSTPTVDLPTINMLWNLVLSSPKAKFITMDVANFYLGTPMERPEYMRLPFKITPQEIIKKYDLEQKGEDGLVYVKILKGMYGLPNRPDCWQTISYRNDLWRQDTTSVNSHQAFRDTFGGPSPLR